MPEDTDLRKGLGRRSARSLQRAAEPLKLSSLGFSEVSAKFAHPMLAPNGGHDRSAHGCLPHQLAAFHV